MNQLPEPLTRPDHRGVTLAYYLDISLRETLRRHAGRPQSATLAETIERILAEIDETRASRLD